VAAHDCRPQDFGVMSFVSDHRERTVERLSMRIEEASAPDMHLFADVIAAACPRALALLEARKADRLKQLIESGAWTDAALVLLEQELPQWKVRRIVCDDGEWHCRLTAQPWLPEGLDEVVETFHRALPLAILTAVVQARQQTAAVARTDRLPAKVAVDPDSIRVCCDNFC